MYKFKFADIAEGLESGKITEFLVKEGDQVKEGQDLFLVETDKVSTEIGSPVTGKVNKIYFKAGDEVKVGEVVMDIDEGGDGVQASSDSPASQLQTSIEQKPVKPVNDHDQDFSVSQPKSTPLARKIADDQGIDLTKVKGTGTNNIITTKDLATKTSPPTPAASVVGSLTVSDDVIPPATNVVNHEPPPVIKATPFLRKQAARRQVDLTKITGTGPAGRIVMDDLDQFLKKIHPTPLVGGKSFSFPSNQQTSINSVPLTATRKAIARQMVLAKTEIPETTLMREANISELVSLRASLKSEAASQNVRLTFMAFFIRACCVALRKIPVVNSSFDHVNSVINYKNFINIGVAVDTPTGLMVPVIVDADQKSILKIATEVVDLANRARSRKLKLSEMKNGTFTISNYGSVGIEFATPVINYPEVAILGVGSIIKKPVINQSGQVVAGSVVPLSLTIDHRVIDGADGARFLSVLINLLETPTKLLLI